MTERSGDLIIISGLSGSGKSIALQSLEDIGYYCVDNLPAFLLTDLSRNLLSNSEQQPNRVAVSIDSRNQRFLAEIEQALQALESTGCGCRILYLKADESVLVRRYSETRRKHPLTNRNTLLTDGIRQESRLIKPLFDRAEKVIDTTDTTSHELRALVRDFVGGGLSSEPLLVLESFGFKFGLPLEADFVFDVRCLPNPYWQEEFRRLTGLDQAVMEFLHGHESVNNMINRIHDFLNHCLSGFAEQGRSYITIGVGCTGGQHRSVYTTEQIAGKFRANNQDIQIRHRELSR